MPGRGDRTTGRPPDARRRGPPRSDSQHCSIARCRQGGRGRGGALPHREAPRQPWVEYQRPAVHGREVIRRRLDSRQSRCVRSARTRAGTQRPGAHPNPWRRTHDRYRSRLRAAEYERQDPCGSGCFGEHRYPELRDGRGESQLSVRVAARRSEWVSARVRRVDHRQHVGPARHGDHHRCVVDAWKGLRAP
jgi:hypothetical protein